MSQEPREGPVSRRRLPALFNEVTRPWTEKWSLDCARRNDETLESFCWSARTEARPADNYRVPDHLPERMLRREIRGSSPRPLGLLQHCRWTAE